MSFEFGIGHGSKPCYSGKSMFIPIKYGNYTNSRFIPSFGVVIQLVLKTLWHPFRNRLLDNDSQFMNYDKPQYVYIYIKSSIMNHHSSTFINYVWWLNPIKIHTIVHDIRIWWVKSHRTPKAWGWNSIQQPPSPNLASFLDLLEIMVESPSKSKKWVWWYGSKLGTKE